MPRPLVELPWGSESISNTRKSLAAKEAPRLMDVVVLSTPPFWFVIAITLSMFHVEHCQSPAPSYHPTESSPPALLREPLGRHPQPLGERNSAPTAMQEHRQPGPLLLPSNYIHLDSPQRAAQAHARCKDREPPRLRRPPCAD